MARRQRWTKCPDCGATSPLFGNRLVGTAIVFKCKKCGYRKQLLNGNVKLRRPRINSGEVR